MITLSSIIPLFENEFLHQYQHQILPSHRQALTVMKSCRTSSSPLMLAQCDECAEQRYIPHSCGHRSCPHCQHHESQQWIERQLKKQVPADYFLLTFTLPQQWRAIAWQHQTIVYNIMLRCAWDTVKTFALNDAQLQGMAGAIAVIHTHSRRLDYHPHVHLVMPAAAIDTHARCWRTKKTKNAYLFNHKALAKVFRAKMLHAISQEAIDLPSLYPSKWVVDCKSVGNGEKALIYLGRYLYKGVLQEKDIIACHNGQVIFRYRDNKTKKFKKRSLPGTEFLWLLMQHVLPKGFRRTRNFGFLHPNSKFLIALIQFVLNLNPHQSTGWFRERPQLSCPCCGGTMRIVATRLSNLTSSQHFDPGDSATEVFC